MTNSSLRCRIGWHQWTPWKPGARFFDTSWGLEVPHREFWSACERCNKPRRITRVSAHGGDA